MVWCAEAEIVPATAPAVGVYRSTSSDSTSQSSTGKVSHLTRGAADQAKWVARRKQFDFRGVPYGLTGLPIAFFNFKRDWTYGGRIHLTDYSWRPFRYRLVLRWVKSTEASGRYAARLTVPAFSRAAVGLRVHVAAGRVDSRYFGEGNSSRFQEEKTEPTNPEFIDEDYYRYYTDRAGLFVHLSRALWQRAFVSVGFGAEDVTFGTYTAAALVRAEAANRANSGLFRFLDLQLGWDSRDDPLLPTRGSLHEWSYERQDDAWLGALVGRPRSERVSITDLRYFAVGPRWTLATRHVFEIVSGDAPMYLYAVVGSSKRRVGGLGGDNSLRGFLPHRFVDDVRFLSNVELRYRVAAHWFRGQYLQWLVSAFSDAGRVWGDLRDIGISGMHLSPGLGLRLHWDADFVVRMEGARSAEQTVFLLKIRRNF